MRFDSIRGLMAKVIAGGLVAMLMTGGAATGDEPGRLGRLFRLGGGSSSNSPPEAPHPSTTPAMNRPAPDHPGGPALSTPVLPSSTGPKLTPRSRVAKPATEADPLISRVSLGRSDNGGQFGMFLHVFADGTVIDGEGVHHVPPDALRPVVEAISSGDLGRLKGHCGGPAGDFIEAVHVVAFERSYGRLRAHSFSYSGSAQGCDHAVHHLQKVLDELQARVSTSAPSTAPPSGTAEALGSPAPGPMSTPPLPLTTIP